MKIITIKHIIVVWSLTFCILSITTSCNSYIEEDTSGLLTADAVGDSREACDLWVTGVYSKWIYDIFCWGYFPNVLELDADYITGPDWLFSAFGTGQFMGNGADIADALWKGSYGIIERSNTAMSHIGAMQNVETSYKNNAMGEMKFHKAFAYFLLVRAYGSVPLLDSNVDITNNPRVSVDRVYQEIFSLLGDAVRLLYKNTDANYVRGHVTKGTAAALLAKAYATAASSAMSSGELCIRTGQPYKRDASGNYEKDADGQRIYMKPVSRAFTIQQVKGYENMNPEALYAKAAEWAAMLIETTDLGRYELVSTFSELWTIRNRYASEFLFQVYVPNNDTKYKTGIHNTYVGTYDSAALNYIKDGGWVGNTYNWYQLFTSKDHRVLYGVKHRWRTQGQYNDNAGFFYPYDTEWKTKVQNHEPPFDDGVNYYYNTTQQCIAFTTKYMDCTDPSATNADTPWPFLRLADIKLIYAEALNETGNQAKAIAQMYDVQRRSHPTAASPSPASLQALFNAADSKTAVRSAIIEERAKEMACEGDRRWDLIRWGVYLQAMNAVSIDDGGVNKERSAKHLLFPIPAQELNTNKALNNINNPGW
jgi:hypothetical protein